MSKHFEEKAIAPDRGQRKGARDDRRLDWWRDAKFGLFIHWGLYAVPAGRWKGTMVPGIGEWIMQRERIPVREYEQLARTFNPVEFDAAEWVAMAKNAGQKYLVITSKHHDGFCMYGSKVTGYNIVDATPFRRDPIKELASECEKQGIKLGFYYSQTQDWHHPNGDGNDWDYDEDKKDFETYIDEYVKPQVTELLTQYGPIGLIWFDTPRRITSEQSKSLLDLCREIQPDCLVSGRLGNTLGDYASTGDNKIPSELETVDWETPATINDTWGFKSDDHNWKTTEDLVYKLVDIVSKGGNYLLNVGPTSQGLIPQPSVDRLLEVGDWLKVNGDSIFHTRPGPIQGLDWCRSTVKEDKLYLHVFKWPTGGAISIPASDKQISHAYILKDSKRTELPVTISGNNVIIQGPSTPPDGTDSVIVLLH